jgi:hypothetical protein
MKLNHSLLQSPAPWEGGEFIYNFSNVIYLRGWIVMSSSSNSTSVEVVTFNMNGKGMALGEVISAIKKNTELIVICIQEADLDAAHYEQQITVFMENYKCNAQLKGRAINNF